MTEESRLILAVDSTQVKAGTVSLDDLAASGGKAEGATNRLSEAQKTLAASAQRTRSVINASENSTVAFITALERQIALHGKSATDALRYDAALLGVTRTQQDHIQALIKTAEAQELASAKQATAIDQLKNMAIAVGAVGLAWKSYEYLKEAALLNARYETLGVAMTVVGKNAGYTASQMDAAVMSMQKAGISMVESRQAAMQLVQAHIDLSASSKLARVAQDAAVIGGLNSSEAFGRLVHGIQSGQVEILRTIGINVQFDQGYKQLAATLGKNAEQLTDNEKTQSRLNQVMDKGKDIAGAYEAAMGTAGKQLLSMQRYTEDAKVLLGGLFNDALTIGVMAYTDHLKDSNAEMARLTANKEMQEWADGVASAFVYIVDSARGVVSTLQTVGATTIWLANSIGNSIKGGIFTPGGASIPAQQLDNAAYAAQMADIWKSADAFRKALADRRAARATDAQQQVDAQDALSRKLNSQDNHHYAEQEAAAKAHTKAAADEYSKLISAITKQNETVDAQIEYGDKLADSKKFELKILADLEDAYGAGKITMAEWSKGYDAMTVVVDKMTAAEERHLILLNETEKAQRRADEFNKDYASGSDFAKGETLRLLEVANASEAAVRHAQLEYDGIGLLKSGVAQLTLTRLQDQLVTKLAGSEAYDSLMRQIDAQRRLIGVLKKTEVKEAGLGTAKKVAEEWRHGWEETDRIAREAFTGWADGGKSAADVIGQALKKALLSAIYEATIKPLAFQLYTSITGGSGASGALGAVGSAANMYSGAGALGSLFGSAGSYGAAIGTTSIGAGSQAAMLAAQTGEFGLAGLTATAEAAGGAIGGLTAALSSIPVWGWAALAAIAVFGGGKDVPKSEGGYAPGGMNIAGLDALGGMQGSQRGDVAAAQTISAGIVAGYQAVAKQLGIKNGKIDVGVFYAQDPTGESQTQLQIIGGAYNRSNQMGGIENAGKSNQDLQDAIAKSAAQLILTNLQSADLPAYMAKVFAPLTSASTAQQINDAVAFASGLKQIRDALTETRTPLQIMADDMAALGTSAENFKVDFVKAIDAGISAENLTAWQHLGQEIEQLTPAAEKAADAIDYVGNALKTLEADRKSLEGQLATLQGRPWEAQGIDLSNAAEAAAWAYNEGLRAQIKAIEDATTAQEDNRIAMEDAVAAAKQLADTNRSRQDQLDIMTGKQTEHEIALRDASDDSTRALMRQVYAMQDASSSMDSFTQTVMGLVDGIHNSVTGSIFQMRYGLQDSAGQYGMLDTQAKQFDELMRASTDINQIAKYAQSEIDTINKAFALLDPSQQQSTLDRNVLLLDKIDSFVTGSGADAVSRKRADNAELSAAVAAAVEKALKDLAGKMTDAAIAQASAADKVANVVREPAKVNVTVSAPRGSEVSVS